MDNGTQDRHHVLMGKQDTHRFKVVLVDKELLKRWRLACMYAVGDYSYVDFPESLRRMWEYAWEDAADVTPVIGRPPSGNIVSVRIPNIAPGKHDAPEGHTATTYLEGLLESPVLPPVPRGWPKQFTVRVPVEMAAGQIASMASWCRESGVGRKEWLKGCVAALWARRDEVGEMVAHVRATSGPEKMIYENMPDKANWGLKVLSLTTGVPVKTLFTVGVLLERDTWGSLDVSLPAYLGTAEGHLSEMASMLESRAWDNCYDLPSASGDPRIAQGPSSD